MSWGYVGAAAVSVVGGYFAGEESRSSAEDASNASRDLNQEQARIAREQDARYKELYLPLERSMVDEANKAGSDTEFAQAAGDASATVGQQFGKARDRLARTPGLDPSSPGYAANMAGLDMAQAAADATGQNTARTNVKNAAWAKKTGVMGLGKGLDSTAAASMGEASRGLSSVAAGHNAQANQAAAGVGQFVSNLQPVINRAFAPSPTPAPYVNTTDYGGYAGGVL